MSPPPASCEQPHVSGGDISRTISDRFPADLPRVGMENDLLDWGSAWHRVHPRSRRENETCAPERCPPYGPSPLTRGKHIMRRGVAHLPGDHSQVGWLPPSCVPCHYSEKDSSLLTRGTHRLICANITQLRQIMEAQLNACP